MTKHPHPQEPKYMKIGELAKHAGISTNTLRYYDKEGLLTPSAESEGGYRLYSEKDGLRLTQILMLKQLGFGLSEIKDRLGLLDSPSDMAGLLAEHATQIRSKIKLLTESLAEIETLKEEIIQMNSVDLNRILSILMMLQMKGTNYWIIKYLDDDFLQTLSENMDREKAIAFAVEMNNLFNEAVKIYNKNVAPESEEAQAYAKRFLEKTLEMVGGDFNRLQEMNSQVEKIVGIEKHQGEMFITIHNFNKAALEAYFKNNETHKGD